METKTPQEILQQLERDRETVLNYLKLQERINNSSNGVDKPHVEKSNKTNASVNEAPKRTGLKKSIVDFLATQEKYQNRTQITKAIVDNFPNETIETLLQKVSNVLSKDRDANEPTFIFRFAPGSKRDKLYSVKNKGTEVP